MSRYWIVRESWRTAEKSHDLLEHKTFIDVAEQNRYGTARAQLRMSMSVGDYRNPVIPLDFPHPRLNLTKHPFAPDYFQVGLLCLVSRHLRNVLALPESAVQYLPIEIMSGGPEIRAQDYRWINVLSCHKAIDMRRSHYEMSEGVRYTTGEIFRFIRSYEHMVFRDDIDPKAELFRVAEDLTTVLASDTLAERVMRAGCTGIAFEDPATYHNGGPIHRYRTVTGVIEEDLNQVFPPTP